MPRVSFILSLWDKLISGATRNEPWCIFSFSQLKSSEVCALRAVARVQNLINVVQTLHIYFSLKNRSIEFPLKALSHHQKTSFLNYCLQCFDPKKITSETVTSKLFFLVGNCPTTFLILAKKGPGTRFPVFFFNFQCKQYVLS